MVCNEDWGPGKQCRWSRGKGRGRVFEGYISGAELLGICATVLEGVVVVYGD